MSAPIQDLARWLLARGGPIVRYRTATELLDDPSGLDLPQLQAELLASEEVQCWLRNLGAGPVHHSMDASAENAMAKLLEYGLRAGIPALDEKALPYCDCGPGGQHESDALIIAPFLIRAGYWDQPGVAAWFEARLDALYRTAQAASYEFLMDASERAALPPSARDKDTYRASFNPVGTETPLPSCYDLYALCYHPRHEAEVWDKVEAVVGYLIDPRFQTTPGGYIWDEAKRQHYAAGRTFLATLPGFGQVPPGPGDTQRLVMFLEMMAHSVTGSRSAWFQGQLAHLEGCRTPEGTSRFPGDYLRERRGGGYYLYGGAHMGLGENRRRRQALEIESTFRMLRLLRTLECHEPAPGQGAR
jgi:hypothetical protein